MHKNLYMTCHYLYTTIILYSPTESALWESVFKVSKGTGDISLQAWSQTGALDGGRGCLQDTAYACESIYKNDKVDTWGDVEEASVCRGLLLDTQNCGLRMRRECWERFPRHRL